MDSLARVQGFRLTKKADLDWLHFQNNSGEWTEKAEEAFSKHLARLSKGMNENLWYGRAYNKALKRPFGR